MLALNVAIQFKLDKFSNMEAQDTSHLAAHDNLRNSLKQIDLNVRHCQDGVNTAKTLLGCVNEEMDFMMALATDKRKNDIEDALTNANFLKRRYNYLKVESTNTKNLVAENRSLVEALSEELEKAKLSGRSNRKQDAQNRIILLNHNNYLMSMQHQLTNALNEMKQLKPLIVRSETELRNLEIKTALDFFTKEERKIWNILCSNKKIANATEAAAVASLEGAKYILEAEKYKSKLFQTENHKDDEITYLLSKYTQLLDLADISAAKAGTAYGVIKHVRNVARLKPGTTGDARTAQTKSDPQKYAAKSYLQSINRRIKDLAALPHGYAANAIFHRWSDEQQAKLQNKQKIAELLYNVSLSEGLLSEASYRLNAYKEKLIEMHGPVESNANKKDSISSLNLIQAERDHLSAFQGNFYILAWELAFHRRNLACERYNQALAEARSQNIDLKDVENATRTEKRIIFDIRKKAKTRRICDEDCANATHDKTVFESDKPFNTWKILGVNNNRSLVWKGSDDETIARMQKFFQRSIEANNMAHDCVFAIGLRERGQGSTS